MVSSYRALDRVHRSAAVCRWAGQRSVEVRSGTLIWFAMTDGPRRARCRYTGWRHRCNGPRSTTDSPPSTPAAAEVLVEQVARDDHDRCRAVPAGVGDGRRLLGGL